MLQDVLTSGTIRGKCRASRSTCFTDTESPGYDLGECVDLIAVLDAVGKNFVPSGYETQT